MATVLTKVHVKSEFNQGRMALRIKNQLSLFPPHALTYTAQEHKHTHHTTNLLKHNIHKDVSMKMREYTNEYKLRTHMHTRHTYIDLHFSHQCTNECLIHRLGSIQLSVRCKSTII